MELVRRIASKWKKVVDKATLLTLGRKFIVCGRSVSWWDEELISLLRIIGLVSLKPWIKTAIGVIT